MDEALAEADEFEAEAERAARAAMRRVALNLHGHVRTGHERPSLTGLTGSWRAISMRDPRKSQPTLKYGGTFWTPPSSMRRIPFLISPWP